MIEPPQFRTVLRGADPDQVAEAIKELQTSLVVARRAAADRTIELSRMQEEHQSLEAELHTAQQRVAELERAEPAPSTTVSVHGYGDLGARIGSMLSLAEEEAAQLRAAAEAEIAERRERAAQDLAAELAGERARLEDTIARRGALEDELAQLRGRADAEQEQMRAQAAQEAEAIRQQARADAELLGREAEEGRAAAVAHHAAVHDRLGEIAAYITGVLGRPGAVEGTTMTPAEATPTEATPAEATPAEATPAERTSELPEPSPSEPPSEPEGTSQGGSHESQGESHPTEAVEDSGRTDELPSPDQQATQVMHLPPDPSQQSVRQDETGHGDTDSFAGDPWQHEEHRTPSR